MLHSARYTRVLSNCMNYVPQHYVNGWRIHAGVSRQCYSSAVFSQLGSQTRSYHQKKYTKKQKHGSKQKKDKDKIGQLSEEDYQKIMNHSNRARPTFPVGVKFDTLPIGSSKFGSDMIKLKSSKHRKESGRILLENKHLIKDAVAGNAKVLYLYFSNMEAAADLPLTTLYESGTEIFKVNHKDMILHSSISTTPGVMAVCEIPKLGDDVIEQRKLPLTIICDAIKDEGHLGAVLRSADAFQCQKLVTTQDCCDIWSSKVMRAAAGAHFRQPITTNVKWSMMRNVFPNPARIFVTDNKPYYEKDKYLLMTREDMDKITKITEELHWQEDKNGEVYIFDPGYTNHSFVQAHKKFPLSTKIIYELDDDDFDNDTVLIVGEGNDAPSAEAIKMAFDHNGDRVCMMNGADPEPEYAKISESWMGYGDEEADSSDTNRPNLLMPPLVEHMNPAMTSSLFMYFMLRAKTKVQENGIIERKSNLVEVPESFQKFIKKTHVERDALVEYPEELKKALKKGKYKAKS